MFTISHLFHNILNIQVSTSDFQILYLPFMSYNKCKLKLNWILSMTFVGNFPYISDFKCYVYVILPCMVFNIYLNNHTIF